MTDLDKGLHEVCDLTEDDILAHLYLKFSWVYVTFPGGVPGSGTWLYRFLIFAFLLAYI